MYNVVAHIALFGWIPVALLLFARLRPPVAATIAFLGPFLLLPAGLVKDWPLIPPIDRHVVGGLGALLGYLLFVPKASKSSHRFRWPMVLIGIQILAASVTVLVNGDATVRGPWALPGLTFYDSYGTAFTRLITIGAPFYLGMKLIRSIDDLADVLRVIVVAGLVYVPIVFWESRMSPQLHAQLYGVFPHSFAQHIRAGGFRPVGFTIHGLELALFMATAAVAAAGLARAHLRVLGHDAHWMFALLLLSLFFCLSLGPLGYGLFFPALIFLTRPPLQARVVALLIGVVLLYPLMRSRDLFPTETLVSAATSLSTERGGSIAFRFDNENRLLEKAAERPLFGWGGWGRNRVYDDENGVDASVTDGYWIIEIGMFGLTGFLSFFGLLTVSALRAAGSWRNLPRGPPRIVLLTACMIVALRVIDFLPNSFPAPFTPYLAGALMSFTATRTRKARRQETEVLATTKLGGTAEGI